MQSLFLFHAASSLTDRKFVQAGHEPNRAGWTKPGPVPQRIELGSQEGGREGGGVERERHNPTEPRVRQGVNRVLIACRLLQPWYPTTKHKAISGCDYHSKNWRSSRP